MRLPEGYRVGASARGRSRLRVRRGGGWLDSVLEGGERCTAGRAPRGRGQARRAGARARGARPVQGPDGRERWAVPPLPPRRARPRGCWATVSSGSADPARAGAARQRRGEGPRRPRRRRSSRARPTRRAVYRADLVTELVPDARSLGTPSSARAAADATPAAPGGRAARAGARGGAPCSTRTSAPATC